MPCSSVLQYDAPLVSLGISSRVRDRCDGVIHIVGEENRIRRLEWAGEAPLRPQRLRPPCTGQPELSQDGPAFGESAILSSK